MTNTDPIFEQEQLHLSQLYEKLESMKESVVEKMKATKQQAAADKKSMMDDISENYGSYSEAMETYVDFATVNRVIDAYNVRQDANAQKLRSINLLLKEPYFAKVEVQFKKTDAPKELYIGTTGLSDDSYHRLVVDWRSPVAEVYYNQSNGPTSYHANGRDINVDLKLRRQFDITKNVLNGYFDTSVAIQDTLLLASLNKQRTAHMQAITATIQKEQNQVIRHADVPVLLVNGIAGSGKTSVLMQRIAYLFYQNRETLDPSEVYLVSPNPVFTRYIDNVLPDLGETNPNTFTWNEFAAQLLPKNRGVGKLDIPVEKLQAIDEAVKNLHFEQNDFKDIALYGVKFISSNQINQIAAQFKRRIPAGSHLVTLIREEVQKRCASRLKQLAAQESTWDEVAALSLEDQVRIFHETINPQNENEERDYALRYVKQKFADIESMVERDEWLRIDRIGARILGEQNLSGIEWLYLKMACTGLSNPYAKFVMIDEVQDYSIAQLAIMARYFRRAHFLLLGDKNQAIAEGTASFDDIKALFTKFHGGVEECHLMTSYRSTPHITDLFASLLPREEQMQVSSIQRDQEEPTIKACHTKEDYAETLRQTVQHAQEVTSGICAIIVPWKQHMKPVEAILDGMDVMSIDEKGTLPATGCILTTLKLAKGLEFDHVIIPNANHVNFPDDEITRRRLYTTISRATKRVSIVACGNLTPLLER